MIKDFLKKNWRSLAIWSGLGGLAVGGAVYAYKKGYVGNPNPAEPIPEDAPELELETHPFEIQVGETVGQAHSLYHLQATSFRIWSVLDENTAGHPVFFVTPTQSVTDPSGVERANTMDSFYAAVGIPRYFKRRDLLDHLRKDSQLVFYLCMVGGGNHGVPTGDKILSRGKLKSWRVKPA
jgi:hypothetical protein